MHSTSSTMITPTNNTTTHILAFPFPAQGHILPLLNLTHKLALLGHKITILITPKNLPILNPLLSTHPSSIQTLILPFPPHPKLPSDIENVKDIGNSGNTPIIASLSKLENEVIKWFKSHPNPPQVIISDVFLGYTQIWAQKLNIPRIGFVTSGAFVTCVFDHLLNNINKFKNPSCVYFENIPRSPFFHEKQLPSLYRKYKKDDPDWEIVIKSFADNTKSWAYVFNSFDGLEGEFLDHMKKELSHERVFSIGPLSSIYESKRVSVDTIAGSGVLHWLDKWQIAGCVLYVCFGSQKVLTKQQIEAVALGLEQSMTRFVWVVKEQDSPWIPNGFEDRISDRGLIVKGWAPQVDILNHNAVGGFLSHCGWNSTLESITAGVMILAWPMEADQFQNAKLLVEYVQLAVGVCEGEDTVPDPNELGRVIKESMSENIPQKENVKVMKQKALEAVKEGGSSFIQLNELVKMLASKITMN
ncbi:unnamed protein product [Amaranthus hypochondriacus]